MERSKWLASEMNKRRNLGVKSGEDWISYSFPSFSLVKRQSAGEARFWTIFCRKRRSKNIFLQPPTQTDGFMYTHTNTMTHSQNLYPKSRWTKGDTLILTTKSEYSSFILNQRRRHYQQGNEREFFLQWERDGMIMEMNDW